ncbi:MAG: sugar phosphate isomerase/epimerase family protein [Isosphaeraceae bacterium]|nr:sugar phosphate isomerase/epimerase family protein [Isosphaeraceae bacterium]
MIRISAFADEISQDPAEQISVLAALGIRHIEFRAIHGVNVMKLSEAQHTEFRNLLQANGFGLSAIGSPIGKIKIGDPFEPHLDEFAKALELADFYETPRIRIFSYYLPEGEAPEGFRDEVLRRMTAKAKLAEARGVLLFLENEKGIYGDTAPRVHDILHSVGSPNLASAFDPANFCEVGQSIDDAWELLRAHTKHIHVKDYDPATHRCVPAGQGAGQIPRIIAEAVASGFSGFCTLEPHLTVAEKMFGYTGPERFGEAARALMSELDAKGVSYS